MIKRIAAGPALAAALIGGIAAGRARLAPSDPVIYLPNEKVAAAFAKGVPLLETSAYKILAARRDKDGQAEVHARDTDIIYVVEGTATFVTGGEAINGKETGAGEIRGDSIKGGESRGLSKGDVIVVPNGVPHLFRDVQPGFLYYVVKVTRA
jgi:glc operon protein GlcG